MSEPPENSGGPSPIPPVRLPASGIETVSMPPPRRFTVETINAWIAEDEADFARLRSGAGDP